MRWLTVPCALMLLLTGCASPDPALYTLDVRPGQTRAGARRVIVVRSVGLPRYLDRPEIVRNSGEARMRVSANDWWGEPLGVMLKRVLARDLAQRLPGSNVLADGGPISVRPDLEVEVEFERFDREPSGLIVLAGHVALAGGTGGGVLQRLNVVVPANGPATRDQVDAMSDALGQAAEIISRLAAP